MNIGERIGSDDRHREAKGDAYAKTKRAIVLDEGLMIGGILAELAALTQKILSRICKVRWCASPRCRSRHRTVYLWSTLSCASRKVEDDSREVRLAERVARPTPNPFRRCVNSCERS